MERVTVTVAEAAKALSVSRTTIFALLKAGFLERIKIGSRTAIPVASVVRFAEHGTDAPLGSRLGNN